MRKVALLRIPIVRAGVALHDGPVKSALGWQVVRLRADIPFARDVGAVTVVFQKAGDSHYPLAERALVSWTAEMGPGCALAQIANARAVTLYACQQHGPRGRTRGRGVKIRKTNPPMGQSIQVGRCNLTAKCTQVGKPPIVGDQDHNVGLWLALGTCVVLGFDRVGQAVRCAQTDRQPGDQNTTYMVFRAQTAFNHAVP